MQIHLTLLSGDVHRSVGATMAYWPNHVLFMEDTNNTVGKVNLVPCEVSGVLFKEKGLFQQENKTVL